MATNSELVTTWRALGPVAWAQGPYGWIDETGQPVNLTPWQAAVLSAWWNNREEVSTLAVSNIKKTGKTFVNAVLTCWRWLALPGVHFCAANDLDQSQSRQFAMIAEMVKRNPYLAQNVRIGQRALVFEPTGSQLQALANDASGNAGANHLTASHTEAWGIFHEGAQRAWEELTPPPGAFWGLPALRIADSYAGYEAESTTWHRLVDRGLAGKRIDQAWPLYLAGGLLLFHMTGEEAQARCFRGSEAEAARYYGEQRDTLREAAFKRMHLNERTSGESQFLPDGAWQACYSREVKPVAKGEKRRLVFAADASTSNDFTALVGTCYNLTAKAVDVRYCKVWKPTRGLGLFKIDLNETIKQEVLDLHAQGLVDCIYCDRYQLASIMQEWERAGIRVFDFPQTSKRIEADQALYTAVIAKTIRHYNDHTLNEHIRNAVAIETPRGFRLAKEKTSLKIDAAVALSMSAFGAVETQSITPVQIVKDPFADWPPPEGAKYSPVWGWYEWGDVNTRPHPAGVTWRNCKHRTKGCDACVAEMEAEGVYEMDRAVTEAKIQEGRADPPPPPAPDYQAIRQAEFLQMFIRNARGKKR